MRLSLGYRVKSRRLFACSLLLLTVLPLAQSCRHVGSHTSTTTRGDYHIFDWPYEADLTITMGTGSDQVTRTCTYLDRGSNGVLYRFTDENNQQKVLKLSRDLDPESAYEAFWWEAEVFVELRQKLLQEQDANLQALASHIVPTKIVDVTYDGYSFKAMVKDFISGSRVKGYPPYPDGTREGWTELYPMIKAGYKAGYVIGDLHNKNFMVDDQKHLWIVDAASLAYSHTVSSFLNLYQYTEFAGERVKADPDAQALAQPEHHLTIDPAFKAMEMAAGVDTTIVYYNDKPTFTPEELQQRKDDVKKRRAKDNPNAPRSGDTVNDRPGAGAAAPDDSHSAKGR